MHFCKPMCFVFALKAASPAVAPVRFEPPKVTQTIPTPQTKSWAPAPSEKLATRDPRLNRMGGTATNAKEQVTQKKESLVTPSFLNASEKRGQVATERQNRLDRIRIPKKDNSANEDKAKSKSVSPTGKGILSKPREMESQHTKSAEIVKKDPRLHKQTNDKTDSKDEDVREKKRSSEKKDRDEALKSMDHQKSRGKLPNGALSKHERLETFIKQEIKAKANFRKRSRSRSRSPPTHSPKRKERRSSPKRKTRSISPPSKSVKPRQLSNPQTSVRDERSTAKKSVSETRRSKRPLEDRPADHKDGSQQRISDHKDPKDGKRWRSGWEENKQ